MHSAWRSFILMGLVDMSSQRMTLGGGFYVPAVLAVITVIYLVSALQLGAPMKGGNMTASFFPIMTAVIMLVALACAMVQAVKQAQQQVSETSDTQVSDTPEASGQLDSDDKSPSYMGISLGALGVVVLTAGYLVAFDWLGYLVSTWVYVGLLICLFSGGIKQNLIMKLVAAAVITGAGYLLFEVFFQVRLPTLWSL